MGKATAHETKPDEIVITLKRGVDQEDAANHLNALIVQYGIVIPKLRLPSFRVTVPTGTADRVVELCKHDPCWHVELPAKGTLDV
jgi:hypothetical protein